MENAVYLHQAEFVEMDTLIQLDTIQQVKTKLYENNFPFTCSKRQEKLMIDF